MEVEMDAQGRVVIPKEIRERARLLPGRRLSLEWREGGLVLRPARPLERFLLRAETRPLRLGRRVALKELKRLEEEQWEP